MEKQILPWLFGGGEGRDISVMYFESFLNKVEVFDDTLPEQGKDIRASRKLEAGDQLFR